MALGHLHVRRIPVESQLPVLTSASLDPVGSRGEGPEPELQC